MAKLYLCFIIHQKKSPCVGQFLMKKYIVFSYLGAQVAAPLYGEFHRPTFTAALKSGGVVSGFECRVANSVPSGVELHPSIFNAARAIVLRGSQGKKALTVFPNWGDTVPAPPPPPRRPLAHSTTNVGDALAHLRAALPPK